MKLTDKELADLYMKYKKEKKLYKQKKRQSLYDLNHFFECKKALSLIKLEMHRRGLKKKHAKKLSSF
ncbi:hypothetical protein [Lysinibacillus sp. SGAir0095]|uniref:hypothetical protein n=1 Tax=Lysinibacillus sp. SGAir0095 TaxID=2070463 RepID=UPI0010CD3807|nr:hypothetical protein [Lysinibacillus sp. SGAir0095]QCR31227.1 hypothetical protein C1N55_03210 [Lysinibacillus sp. SGAir0095]